MSLACLVPCPASLKLLACSPLLLWPHSKAANRSPCLHCCLLINTVKLVTKPRLGQTFSSAIIGADHVWQKTY